MLFRRVKEKHLSKTSNELEPISFQFRYYEDRKKWEDALSFNWTEKCKTKEECLLKWKKSSKQKFYVCEIRAENIRIDCKSNVTHSPTRDDDSHTSVIPIWWVLNIVSDEQKHIAYGQLLADNAKLLM